MTQEQVANAVGVDPVSFRHYEYGKRFPKPEILERMAVALNVRESAFFERPGDVRSQPANLPAIFQTLAKHSRMIELMTDLDDEILETFEAEMEALVEARRPQSKSKQA